MRFHNLQRARFLKQQSQKIKIRIQTLKSDFLEFKSFEMLNLENADAQSTNAQSTIFKKSDVIIAIDALLLQIILSLKSKIIKFKKMKTYKN